MLNDQHQLRRFSDASAGGMVEVNHKITAIEVSRLTLVANVFPMSGGMIVPLF